MNEFKKFILTINEKQLESYIRNVPTVKDCTQEEILELILQSQGLSTAEFDVIPTHLAESDIIRTMPAHTCIDQPSLACPACVAAHLNK